MDDTSSPNHNEASEDPGASPDSASDRDDRDEGIGALADRAREMLQRVKGEGERIVDAAAGAIAGAAAGTEPAPGRPPGRSAEDIGGAAAGAASPPGAPDDDATSPIVAAATAGTVSSSEPRVVTPAEAGGTGGTRGPSGRGGGGGGGGDGSGGSGPDDDDEKLLAEIPISGRNQIVWLGLLVAGIMLFGSTVWSWVFGSEGESAGLAAPITAVVEGPCDDVRAAFEDAGVDPDDFADVECRLAGSSLQLEGEVRSLKIRQDLGALAAGAVGLRVDNALTVERDDPESDGDAAAATTTTVASTPDETTTTTTETTTTEEATATTTTTEATTTTQQPTTTVPVAYTMWDALNDSGLADQFATLGGVLGLREDLEALEVDGSPIDRTLFAPNDAALATLDPALVSDQEAAAAVVGYHFVDERLLAADIAALDGQTVTSRTGLPLSITVEDGEVVLNGVARVVGTDFESDNGVVHVIDAILDPPTVNEVLGLDNIEFEVNSAVITAAGQSELQKAVDFFTANPDVSASIEGHTDTDGSEDSNQLLSEQRAAAVKDFLVQNGLDAERFTTAGFGESRPVIVDGVEDKAASRRIEFVIR